MAPRARSCSRVPSARCPSRSLNRRCERPASIGWPRFYTAIDSVRRGGTISLSGVYGGQSDPLPMLTLFDKQVTLRMGQANVRRRADDILPLLTEGDPLGVDGFATHHLPLSEAPRAYKMFQEKTDGAVKIVFQP